MASRVDEPWPDTGNQLFKSPPLAEYGMSMLEGTGVKVVKNTDNTVHITLPAPPDGDLGLSDGELRVAGATRSRVFMCWIVRNQQLASDQPGLELLPKLGVRWP